jgi:sugar/nucleoside kinase (ribokinase family)
MTPMAEALDWLAVGDVAEERSHDNHPAIGGTAGRLVAHAASLKASTAIVGKVGTDEPADRVRDGLARMRVELRWLRVMSAGKTTIWFGADGPPQQRRVERGADLNLRLDELPPASVKARLTVVSGYSLSVEPSRSAAMGALSGAPARGGRAALLVDAQLLWSTNSRMTRRVLEPALAAADSIALTDADARLLVGLSAGREATRLLAGLGPRIVYLVEADGSVMVREGGRIHRAPAPPSAAARRDRLAGPAAFWVALAQNLPVATALSRSARYAGRGKR